LPASAGKHTRNNNLHYLRKKGAEHTMKGVIVQCLQELVITRFGKDPWEKSLTDLGLKRYKFFLPIENVDDRLVMNIVTAVCRNLNISLIQAADAFGEYWVNTYSQKMYAHYYAKYTTAREFLLSMDTLHVTMTKMLQDANPPRFEYAWKNERTLLMVYKSQRGLLDFMVGLVKAVGTFYNEELNVTKSGPNQIQIIFPS
jgi:hypothetical protein